jgi:L-alanine-DL-glutamate epimerase-like enolase superfamily enzyme
MLELMVDQEDWILDGTFIIARGAQTISNVVVVTLKDGASVGRGECEPQDHYGETVESVVDQIESIRDALESGLTRTKLLTTLPAGAARNAIDCALWDLESKQQSTSAWRLAGLEQPEFINTDFTISLDSSEAMSIQAQKYRRWPVLKLKLGGQADDLERVGAVHEATPGTRFTIDANESWSMEHLVAMAPEFSRLGVVLIEQPLPAGQDAILSDYSGPIPLCADESCHSRESLPRLRGLYDVVNIKLDKTGGLTEALLLAQAALSDGFQLMTGCMTGTSLAMAPATLVASLSKYVDLDGALMLKNDRQPAMKCNMGQLHLPNPVLWG